MNKVTFTFKTGRERVLSERDARLLQRLGKGTYLTRDMAAAPVIPAVPVVTTALTPAQPVAVDLDAMDTEALHELAKERGVKVHPRAGAEKVRAALREAAANS